MRFTVEPLSCRPREKPSDTLAPPHDVLEAEDLGRHLLQLDHVGLLQELLRLVHRHPDEQVGEDDGHAEKEHDKDQTPS